jgi:hypothetical protein
MCFFDYGQRCLSMLKKAFHYLRYWENWHWFAKYIFIGPAWLWFCLKARSFWFFTPSNPTITFGGFVGETKGEIYRQLPEGLYPKTVFVSPGCSLPEVFRMIKTANIEFPLAVKPDVGMMGFMFRVIESADQLRRYHHAISARYVIQEFISYPVEVSVFYYRLPYEASGRITGFVKKEFMEVTGDGERSLRQLILEYPRAQFRIRELFSKHEGKLETVIAKGQRFVLSQALNLSRGGKLVSLEHEKDARLLEFFDWLSHRCHFYYGRYDIRCKSIADLKERKNFSILEFNGCGAEPHHVYGNNNSFFTACRILIQHWAALYRISVYNREKGLRPWGFIEGRRFMRKARAHFAMLRKLDVDFELDETPPAVVSSDSSIGPFVMDANRRVA